MSLYNDLERILITEEEILSYADTIAKKIEVDYKDKDLICLGLLKGCNPFMSDLLKRIDLPLEVEYMDVSSYHGGVKSSGEIKIIKDIDVSVSNKDILIIEDIVDSGTTINKVAEILISRGANSVEVASMLEKPEGRKVDLYPKYYGTIIPNEFIIGYGLDYEEKYRNLRCIGILKKELYKKGE